MSEVTTSTPKMEPAVYPAVPTSIRQINLAYIHTFIKEEFAAGKITKEQLAPLWADYKALQEQKGAARYFVLFRKKFAKAFFPKLIKEEGAKQFDLGALFNDILG